jgi:hypothetical protein
LSGYGKQFDKHINLQSLEHDVCNSKEAPKDLPTLLLQSEMRFYDTQCLTMSADLFDPTFCASLRSELKMGTDAFEVFLYTGCSFAMTHDLKDFASAPIFDDWGSVQTASTSLPLTAFGTILTRFLFFHLILSL